MNEIVIQLQILAACRTKLFRELRIFVIEPFANTDNAHLLSIPLYITKVEPRTQKF
mgnify:CR=1